MQTQGQYGSKRNCHTKFCKHGAADVMREFPLQPLNTEKASNAPRDRNVINTHYSSFGRVTP